MPRALAQRPLAAQPGVVVGLAVGFDSPELQAAVEYALQARYHQPARLGLPAVLGFGHRQGNDSLASR